jgi:hypothetical protein
MRGIVAGFPPLQITPGDIRYVRSYEPDGPYEIMLALSAAPGRSLTFENVPRDTPGTEFLMEGGPQVTSAVITWRPDEHQEVHAVLQISLTQSLG